MWQRGEFCPYVAHYKYIYISAYVGCMCMCVRAHCAGVFNKKFEGGFFLGVIILNQREMFFVHQLPVFAVINKGGTRPGRIW